MLSEKLYFRKSTIGLEIICSLLVFLFAYTSFSKLHDLKGFATDMYNQPLPHWFTVILIPVLPIAELTIAACLMLTRFRKQDCTFH